MLIITNDLDDVIDLLDLYQTYRGETVFLSSSQMKIDVIKTIYRDNKNVVCINSNDHQYRICGLRPKRIIVLEPHTIEEELLKNVYAGFMTISSDPIREAKKKALIDKRVKE